MVIDSIRIITLGCCLSLLLSGCASVTPDFSWLDFTEEEVPRATGAPEQDPDLQPLETEFGICFAQELEALKLTGDWDTPTEDQTRPPVVYEFSGPPVSYDFPITVNRQVEAYLTLFQGTQRKYFRRWLERSGRYLPLIHQELAEAGLPLDLAYLAMIESGFNQRAYSRSRAVGLWQFMRGTGRDYHLEVNRYLDERRDAIKSTKAAIAYLKDLYREFGDWYLAVAAYNGGPGTMRKAIRRSNSTDFWKIAQQKSLRLETKRYVPKLIAAIMIAKEPEAYGFTNVRYQEPLKFETISVGPGLNLEAAALLTDCNRESIKELNLELRTDKTPLDRERYALKIPAGTRALAENNLDRLHSVATTSYKTHVINSGETLSQICRRYQINTTTLLKVNNLKSPELVAGKRLRIPYRTIHYRILPEGMDPALAAQDDLILHTIRKGETLSKISKQYQVPVELIVSWNGLSSIHRITAGQQLALYLNEGNAAAPEPDTGADQVAVFSNTYKSPPDNSEENGEYRWYLVRSGDSLWTISRRFNTSPAAIRKWNNLKSNLIHPGSRLKLRDV